MFYASLVLWLVFYIGGTALETARVRQGRWPARGRYRSSTSLAANLVYSSIVGLWGIPVVLLDFNIGDANNAMQDTIVAFALGWFVVNTTWLFLERFWKIDVILQSFICIGGLIWVLHSGRNGWEMTAAASFGEMLPCLYLGQLAKRWKFGGDRFQFINDSLFVGSYIITRFCIFSALAYILIADDTPMILVWLALGLLALSHYWGVLIIRKYLDRWGHKL